MAKNSIQYVYHPAVNLQECLPVRKAMEGTVRRDTGALMEDPEQRLGRPGTTGDRLKGRPWNNDVTKQHAKFISSRF